MNKIVLGLLTEAQHLIGKEPYEWCLVWILRGDEITFSGAYTDEQKFSVTTPDLEIWRMWMALLEQEKGPGRALDVVYIHNHPHPRGRVAPSAEDFAKDLILIRAFMFFEVYRGIIGEFNSLLYTPRSIKALQDVPADIAKDPDKSLKYTTEHLKELWDSVINLHRKDVVLRPNVK